MLLFWILKRSQRGSGHQWARNRAEEGARSAQGSQEAADRFPGTQSVVGVWRGFGAELLVGFKEVDLAEVLLVTKPTPNSSLQLSFSLSSFCGI